jgi:hypothetical protein
MGALEVKVSSAVAVPVIDSISCTNIILSGLFAVGSRHGEASADSDWNPFYIFGDGC